MEAAAGDHGRHTACIPADHRRPGMQFQLPHVKGLHKWAKRPRRSCKAPGPEDYFKFFQIRREGHFHQLRTFTPLEWESLYLNPGKAGRFVRRNCGRSVRSLRILQVGVRWFLHRWNRLNSLDRVSLLSRLMADGASDLASLETSSVSLRAEFQKGLRELDADDDIKLEDVGRPEAQFFVTVWLPSMLLLGKCPAKLYRQAGEGDLAAVCELIRLDPFAVQLPAIQQLYRDLLRENSSAKLEAFRLAQTESVDLPNGRAKFKEQFAAKVITLSHGWCEIIGDPKACLDPVDLWNLFDLVAKERGHGNDLVDLKNYETFRKHVRDCEIELSMEGWDIFR
ncbi:hypothetical protein [Planctomyces sp. SH-PL14]|uniref:hypothetical protein n=1 Tax=Planctomyces sp. SH-PL14 TaxID=1632864 RepID=UPI0012E73311|nr:hypothetical protein [Planctomyces sp. SH-PL14]